MLHCRHQLLKAVARAQLALLLAISSNVSSESLAVADASSPRQEESRKTGATLAAIGKEGSRSWQMTWAELNADWTLQLLAKEIRIWLSCASLANFTYLVQSFLAMGWYLLTVNKVNAEVQYEVTKQLLVFSILLYYCFELHNQISGHEADRIDKPYRPIPRGLMTLRGAAYRLVAVSSFFMLYAWSCGVLFNAVCFQALLVLHYWLGWHAHWFTRNVWNGMGISMFLITAAGIVMHAVPMVREAYALQIGAAIGVMVTITVQIQDLHDAKGDAVHGRYTLMHAIGDNKTRWATAAALLMCAVAQVFIGQSFMQPLTNMALHAFSVVQFAFSLAVGAHILLRRGSSHDAISWILYAFNVMSWCFTPLLCVKYLCVI